MEIPILTLTAAYGVVVTFGYLFRKTRFEILFMNVCKIRPTHSDSR